MNADGERLRNLAQLGAWFVVYVEPSREQLSADLLTESGYEVYLPKYTKKFKRCGIEGEIELPMFSRYVFCRLSTQFTARIIGTPGVVKLIGFHNGKGTIGDSEIQLLRKLEASGVSPFHGLAVGNRVRVKRGVFQGVEGTLVMGKGTGKKSKLIISLLAVRQMFSLEVDESDVELI
jgi:transcriptional antiterminator RfaH